MRQRPTLQGYYEIQYSSEQFRRAEKGSADLRVCVMDENDNELVSSDVLDNAPAEAVIDLTLPFEKERLSEYERLYNAIQPLLKGQGEGGEDLPFAELNEKDIDFLAKITGEPRERIAFLAAAAKTALESGASSTHHKRRAGKSDRYVIPVAAFYGWFRQGLPGEPVALWATPTETLLLTLRTAIKQRIVPSSISADLDDISKLIEQIKLDHVLKAPAPGTSANLGDLLATMPAPLSVGQQRAIAAAVTDLRLDDPDLVNRIAEVSGFDGDAVGVARTLRLGALTEGHLPLVQALHLRPELAKEPEGSLRPLAALRPDEWIDLAYTHGTPDELTITPVAYADALAASVELQHPTAALAANVAEGRRLSIQPLLEDVGIFLQDNPDFDIEMANLNTLGKQSKLSGVPEPRHEQLVTGLRAVQCMRLLTASLDETATFFENELYSPHQLLAAGPGQLTTLLKGKLAPERVMALYRQAQELHDVTLATYTAAFSSLSGPQIMQGRQFNPDDPGGAGPLTIPPKTINPTRFLTPYGKLVESEIKPEFPSDTELSSGPKKIIENYPTLQTLFGSQDACACGHCSSVLGPAAYFVDVLQFIKNAHLDWMLLGDPYLYWIGRRPDLQDLELSCNNTNTVVPAIDLALEVLENAVALPLKVLLPAGTNVDAQLINGQIVGAAVRTALEKTVRNLGDEVRATLDTSEGYGWTVVDGHLRWKLTAQKEDALKAGTVLLDTGDLDPQAVIDAMNQGEILSGAEDAFVKLFTNRPSHVFKHKVTVTPKEEGSWLVEYYQEAKVLIDLDARKLQMQTPAGVVLWDQVYGQKTIAALEKNLSDNIVPELVQRLLVSRFSRGEALTVAPADAYTWTIASDKRELTLRFTPAQINIISLTYQSGDPRADALAWPENHNPEAYEQLKKANFPWSLPVDLPLEEVRMFLKRARSSRLQLIELMLPVDWLLRNDDTVNSSPDAHSTSEDIPLVFSRANRNAITVESHTEDTLTTTVSVTNGTLNAIDTGDATVKNNGKEDVTISGSALDINYALDGMAFNPTADYNGTAKLTISTTDGISTYVERRKVRITPVVDIAGDTAATEEEKAVTIQVLDNDSFENTERIITAVNDQAITAGGPAVSVIHGRVALNGSGQLIFTPEHDYSGQASFTYTVTSGGVTETATVYVTVNSANYASFALEVLGLSEAEATLIGAEKTDSAVYEYWGVSSHQIKIWDAASGVFLRGESPLDLLKNVSILLQQSRLEFRRAAGSAVDAVRDARRRRVEH